MRRKRRSLQSPLGGNGFPLQSLLLLTIAGLAWRGFPSNFRVDAFVPSPLATTSSPRHTNAKQISIHHPPITTETISRTSSRLNLFDNDNNNNNNNAFIDLLLRRFEKADKVELKNDATLVACYVLCRFLAYDITSGAKIQPGWEVQDWIWLTGTFSSATVLVIYYTVAGLLSRSFEVDKPPPWLLEQDDSNHDKTTTSGSDDDDDSAFGSTAMSTSVVRALVNVALCCPVWLATEHLFAFGPSDIGGKTLSVAVATGFLGFGSFMALAKTLTSGMR